jgi:hypothetical protein
MESSMIVQSAFDAPGRWYRGNLHTHTAVSDGLRTPAEAVTFYRDNGYDFMALTDHMIYADTDGFNDGQFLVIPGIEIHGDDPLSRVYHIVGLGGSMTAGARLAELNDLGSDIRRLLECGALVTLCHPYWSGQVSAQMAQIDGPIGLEVYNGVADVGYQKGYSHVHWDDLLTAGRHLWGLAVDDAHWLPWRADAGLGWVMVKATELSTPAILEAVRLGRFYATTGPAINNMYVEGDEVVISCSPAMSIAAIGERWFCSAARSATGQGLTEARLRLWPGQTYVRAEIVDRAGKRAWSNPIFLQ